MPHDDGTLTPKEQREYTELYYRLTRERPDLNFESPEWANQDLSASAQLALLREEAAAQHQDSSVEDRTRSYREQHDLNMMYEDLRAYEKVRHGEQLPPHNPTWEKRRHRVLNEIADLRDNTPEEQRTPRQQKMVDALNELDGIEFTARERDDPDNEPEM